MDDNKKEHVEADPFALLAGHISSDDIGGLMAAASAEEMQEKLAQIIGEEHAARIIQEALAATGHGPSKASDEDWAVIKEIRNLVSDYVITQRARGFEDQMRLMSVHLWAANMAALREIHLREGIAFEVDDEEQTTEHTLHILRHVMDALFAMTILCEAFRLDWEKLEEQFFEATGQVVTACEHEAGPYTLMKYVLGGYDGYELDALLPLLAADMVGMTGLVTSAYDITSIAGEEMQTYWDRNRAAHFEFPYAVLQ